LRCSRSPISISSAAGLRLPDGEEGLEDPRVVALMPENPSHSHAAEPRPDRPAVIFRGSLERKRIYSSSQQGSILPIS
jgi:hypothetical protein